MDFFHSPIVKTIGVAVVGTVGPIVLSLIDHPSGGTLDALQHNSAYAGAYAIASYFVHNLWSSWQAQNPTPQQGQASNAAATQATVR